MRYYVFIPRSADTPPYVLAETGRESFDAGSLRDSSLASAIAGSEARILTEEELLAQPGGRQALEAWRMGDDRSFDRDTDRFDKDARTNRGSGLRLVDPDEGGPRPNEGAA